MLSAVPWVTLFLEQVAPGVIHVRIAPRCGGSRRRAQAVELIVSVIHGSGAVAQIGDLHHAAVVLPCALIVAVREVEERQRERQVAFSSVGSSRLLKVLSRVMPVQPGFAP